MGQSRRESNVLLVAAVEGRKVEAAVVVMGRECGRYVLVEGDVACRGVLW
jgi:hypothetical protein